MKSTKLKEKNKKTSQPVKGKGTGLFVKNIAEQQKSFGDLRNEKLNSKDLLTSLISFKPRDEDNSLSISKAENCICKA